MSEPDAAPDRPAGLSQRVLAGATLLVGGSFAVRLIGVASIAVLARLLSPADYGVVALALVAVGLAQRFSELNVANALLRLPKVEPHHYDTAFTLALVRGAAVGGALFLLAGPIAAATATPELAPVLRWMAVVPLLDGLVNPRFIDFARQMDFRREAAMAVAAKVVFLLAAVGVALMHADHWALVVGTIAAAAAGTLATHALRPWRPGIGLRDAGHFVGFGLWLTAAGTVNFVNYKADTVLIGATLGPAPLGQFAMGDQIATMATHQIATPITRAIFGGLARIGDDRARLARAYLRAQTSVMAVLLPAGVGTALVAAELVRVAAGPQWAPAVPVLQVLAPTIAFSMVQAGAQSLLMVRDDTRSLFTRNLAILAVRMPLVVAGVLWFGVPGVLGATVLGTLFLVWVTLRVVADHLGGHWTDAFRAGWRSYAACAAMVGGVLALGSVLPDPADAFWPSLGLLAAKAAAGAALYVGAHLALWHAAGRPDGVERTGIEAASRLGQALARRGREGRA